MKRIAVCGEIHSANLGDQAIHACLLYLLERLDPRVETISLDLSGRSGPPVSPQSKPGLRQRSAAWQPKPRWSIAALLINAAQTALRLERLYAGIGAHSLEHANSLVIGGGQLLMDNGLNFPLKIAGAVRQAQRWSIPWHFSACGVGRSWSPVGHTLFAKALERSATITLRDHLSAERLGRLLPGLSYGVTFDPAIWAGVVYHIVEQPAPEGLIGLGVLSRAAFNARTTSDHLSSAAWMDLWLHLLGALLQSNHPVRLFTTGDSADQQFASALHAQAAARGWRGVDLIPQPVQVPALVGSLGACRVVVAARLHATVLANAFGTETVGLLWDEKVGAYYQETGRPDQCFALDSANVNDIARTARELNGQPFSQTILADLRERALENARQIFNWGC